MAAKKKSRYYPVQSKVHLSNGGICIVPNVLSMINRRHYPASGVYEVNITIEPQTPGVVAVYALKDNWDTIGAIRLAYKAYQEATADERKNLKGNVARWEDFRIAHDTGLTEMAPMVYDHGVGFTSLAIGEFANVAVEDAAGNLKRFSIEAAGSLSVYNILTEWSQAGNVDPDPVVTTGGAGYSGLQADNDYATAQQLQAANNNPPYDAEGNDGLTSAWTKVATLNNSAVGAADGRLSTGFFRAPLGMVIITGIDANGAVFMQAREGSTKGIKVHNILG